MALNIMVVDDRPELLVSLRAMLEPLGSEVMTFADSGEAAERLKIQKFDAFFVDVQMPHLDGFELTKLIRSSELNAKVPVIMLTDIDDIQTMRSAFKAGATYFLGKPVAAERVQSLFNAVLGPVLMQRRKQARLPFQTSLSCSLDQERGKQFMARSLNISISGMALDCSTALEAGEILNLEFSLPSVDQPLHLSARVQRLMPPNQYGVSFIDPSMNNREAIQAFLFPVAATGLLKTPAEKASESADQRKSLFRPVAYVVSGLVLFYLGYQMVSQFRHRALDADSPSAPVLKLACNVQAAPPSQPPSDAGGLVDSPFLTLEPAVIQARFIPGQSVSYTLTLNNQSNQELNFTMAAEDMVELQGRLVHLAAGELANGIAAGAVFSNPTMSVKASERGSVNVTLTPPLDSMVHSVLISLMGTDKIPSWRGILLQANPGMMITFPAPVAAGQKTAATDQKDAASEPKEPEAAAPATPPQSSMMNYTVCKWRSP